MQRLRTCAAWRPDTVGYRDPVVATRLSLKYLACRILNLNDEIAELDRFIVPLVEELAPSLLELEGVGTENAGAVMVAVGDNPDRLRSEASFAMMCGVCPIPASSGKTQRHRLNRGGNRQANAALHMVVVCRMRTDQRTRAYVARRTLEGLSKPEIMRCLKRCVAREIYRVPHGPIECLTNMRASRDRSTPRSPSASDAGDAGVRPSTGSVGDCYDNAMCESFFATLEWRTARSPEVPVSRRSADGRLRVHRGLVQSTMASLRHRISVTHRLLKEPATPRSPKIHDRPRNRGNSRKPNPKSDRLLAVPSGRGDPFDVGLHIDNGRFTGEKRLLNGATQLAWFVDRRPIQAHRLGNCSPIAVCEDP